jgi:hypothetical protein
MFNTATLIFLGEGSLSAIRSIATSAKQEKSVPHLKRTDSEGPDWHSSSRKFFDSDRLYGHIVAHFMIFSKSQNRISYKPLILKEFISGTKVAYEENKEGVL